MVDNYNVKDEEFKNLFGSRKRKKELAATKAELESVKANQQVLQDTLTRQQVAAIQSGVNPNPLSVGDESKPNWLLWGGIGLVVVVGGVLLINRK
jgi:LPXTG-motif cell wall-anchored protein